MQWALARFAVLSDGLGAATRLLSDDLQGSALGALDERELAAFVNKGQVPAWFADEAKQRAFLAALGARLHRWDATSAEREQRKQKLAYTGLLDPRELGPSDDRRMAAAPNLLESVRAGDRAKKLAEKLEGTLKKLGLKPKSRASLLAEEVGVPAKVAREWLSSGRISERWLAAWFQYEEQQKSQAKGSKDEDRVFRELMRLGRKKATKKVAITRRRKGRVVSVEVEQDEPETPTFRASNKYYGGSETSGWRWGEPIRQYLTAATLPMIVATAARFKRPSVGRFKQPGRFPSWSVYVVVSSLYGKEGRTGRVQSVSGRYKYGDKVRQDLSNQFPRLGNRFVVSDVYSSGEQGSFKAALAEFQKRLREEYESDQKIWVHGVVVWNYRRRTEAEQKAALEVRRLEMEARRKKRVQDEAKLELKEQRAKEREARRASARALDAMIAKNRKKRFGKKKRP